MTLDRYVRVVLTVIAIALAAIALNPWLALVREPLALPRAAAETAQAKYEHTIPKAWGRFVATPNGNTGLEGPTETLGEWDPQGRRPATPRGTWKPTSTNRGPALRRGPARAPGGAG